MDSRGLEVRLHEGRERAEAARVARTLSTVVRTLEEIDQVHLLRGSRPKWVMADMSRRNQDLILRLEPRHAVRDRDLVDMLVPAEALVSGSLALAELPEVPRLFAPVTVSRVAALAKPKEGVEFVTFSTYDDSGERSAPLSNSVYANATAAVKQASIAYGTVTGRLSALRDPVRGGGLRVTIRDERDKRAVDGFVPESREDELRGLWRHRVSLAGKVRRNARGQAIRIDVDQIARLPEGNQGRPSTDELLGVGADWLDGLSVDEFLQGMRDA